MKVLHVTSLPIDSGAAKGALRLHQGLLEIGIDSTLAGDIRGRVSVPNLIDFSDFLSKVKRKINNYWNTANLVRYPKRTNFLFTTGFDIANVFSRTDFSRFDIINLHWVNYGLGLSSAAAIARNNCVVWTMRDMWAFTGGCHYSLSCQGYVTECGSCPQLGSRKQSDLSRRVFARKKESYRKIEFVAISEWLRREAYRSGLFSEGQIHQIYNSVDVNLFFPQGNKSGLRRKYGVPTDRRVVLVGAHDLTRPYKGGELVKALLRHHEQGYFYVFFGLSSEEFSKMNPEDSMSFGFVTERVLADLYNLSDVFLMLSQQEAFGKTVIEALACGTPVVALAGSGPAEILEHFGLKSFSPSALMGSFDAVETAISDFDNTVADRVAREMSNRRCAENYAALYERLLANRSGENRLGEATRGSVE